MDKKSLQELSESFRRGLLDRRDFIQRVVLSAGGAVAASQVLSKMGFEPALIQEAQAQQVQIIAEEITFPSGNETVNAYLARPAQGGPFPTMIVIHEIFGLSQFTRDVARLFARNGYLALAPELLPMSSLPDGRHAQWMLDTIRTGEAIVPRDEQDKLRDAYGYLRQRDDVDPSHIGSVGFCWGGARSFTFATLNPNLWLAVVFYGSTPPYAELDSIECPVLGLYGSLDNASPTSITGRAAETAREMRDREKTFEWEVYALAPHGFFRAGTPPDDHVADTRPALMAKDLVFDFLRRSY
jgi:carboxymethylenebutenolidase